MSNKRIRVVSQSLNIYDRALLPGGYIMESDHATAPIHLRTALEIVRDNDLRYWFRLKRHDIEPSPMLATMQFAPWTCFSIARRTEDGELSSAQSILNRIKQRSNETAKFKSRMALGSAWYDYFCFQRAEDLALFKMAWG